MAEPSSVLLLATGGTIANPRGSEGYLSGRELLDEVPGTDAVADVAVRDVARTGSSGMTFETWFDLHREIETAARSDDPPDGVVVTHGSNTVEETAYFLHLTVNTEIPVVLTAAQRNHRLAASDGPRNLLDALRVAGHSDARGRGAMVVINEEIHSARDVTKVVSGRPDAWRSANLGVLGLLDNRDTVAFLRRSERRHAPDTEFDVSDAEPADLPRVEIVYSAVETDGRLVDAAVENGADGIVLAGLPTGHPASTGQAAAIGRAREAGLPVVQSHRGQEGWGYPTEGYVWGSTLTPQKARILLALALLETDDDEEIQRMFERY